MCVISIGIRPLFINKHDLGYSVSSETCAFNNENKQFIEVNPEK